MKRYWQILETIVSAGKPLSASEIAQLSSIPRATCYRLVTELAELAIIDAVDDRHQYVLGIKFVRLALLGKADSDISRAVSSALQKLANQFGETAFIARYRGNNVELIHTELPQDSTQSFIYPGLGVRPVHACSSAKAIAAFADEEVLIVLLLSSFEQFTGKTNTSRNRILEDLNEVKERGFAICDQEIDEGVVSVAAPVFIKPAGVLFSIGFVGPSKRMYMAIATDLEPVLKTISAQVAGAMEYCAPLETSIAAATKSDLEDWPTGLLV